MTRKDCAAIAEVFKSYLKSADDNHRTAYWLHKRMADMLKADNPRFDRDKFEAACGFNDWS